ncbi:hypothetical protein BKA70DRAFT_1563319 [Coprinopsis sp. MPI-PUGE-AT-0042]|nr:hypothetical protein BKA70DRAFT_1563319 [Coprinopsis sp. MPI-PUGE-AT-0042]
MIMEETQLEAGTYALRNSQYSRHALDTKDGLAVVRPYIASESQHWKLTTSDGAFWHVQNVESGRYLGLPIHERAQDSVIVREVDHKFAWHMKMLGGHRYYVLYVPYSSHIVDINPEMTTQGSDVLLNQDGQGDHQVWILCEDPQLDVSSTLEDGHIYQIISMFHGYMYFDLDTKKVSCSRSETSGGGQFRAVRTDHGWAFQHVQTQRYLGIPHTIALDDAIQVSTVVKPFTWMIIPDAYVSKWSAMTFEIWLPFASRVLNLRHDLNVKVFRQTPDSDCFITSWQFEPCDEPLPSPTPDPPESDRKDKEHIPGPKERLPFRE